MLAALNSWAFAPPPAEPEPSPRYGLNSEWEPRPWFDWSEAYIADFVTSYSYQAELDAEMSRAMAQDEVPLPFWYEDDGTIRPSYSYEDDGTAWPSYSYDLEQRYMEYLAGQESKESKKSKKLNRQYDEAVQRLEKSYTSPIHDGADWWNWELGPSPSPDPETHRGDQHGWAAEWYRLWGEMQRKQQAEIEARLQASRVEKFYVDFMSVWSKLWSNSQAEPNAEAAKQDVKVMTFKELKHWYWECVSYGGVVVEPEGLEDDGPLCQAARADGWDGW